MVKNVGRKVPMIEPIVFKASSNPITFPDTFWSKENLINDGVTLPKNNRGGTKIIKHENKDAQITKLLVTKRARRTETPAIINGPTNGIKTIHAPANNNSK